MTLTTLLGRAQRGPPRCGLYTAKISQTTPELAVPGFHGTSPGVQLSSIARTSACARPTSISTRPTNVNANCDVGQAHLDVLVRLLARPAPGHAPSSRSAHIFFSWWSGGPFQADGGGEERAGRGCKWPGRTYLKCLGPLHWSLGSYDDVWPWQSSCCWNVTTADLLRWYTCMRLQQLPSPCPLLLPSRLRPPGTRPRAYPPPTDEPSLAVSPKKPPRSCF